jgi:DNA modification methylase
VLFAEQDGSRSAAQIKAFEDTWRWDQAAANAYEEAVENGGDVSNALQAFRTILGPSNMLAYLAMMAPRLWELHRVLKPTGSLYLHCDPTASHYLKLLLDAVFGPARFRSEIIWKRTSAHSSAKRYGPVHDTILFYTKTDIYTWQRQYQPLPQETIDQWYNNIEPETGRRFNRDNLTAAGVRKGPSGSPWRGIDPTAKGRHWAVPGFVAEVVEGKTTADALDALDEAGRLFWPKSKGGVPMVKRYLEESRGIPAQDVVTHISPLKNKTRERLGYPTQKPEELLRLFVEASTKPGDVVLDPFCGCGTAIAVAHGLDRQWVGIDITFLATHLIKNRLFDAFGSSVAYDVIGEPQSVPDARELARTDPYQFQAWALGLVDARKVEQQKGADHGIDGRLLFHEKHGGKTRQIIISVKAGRTGVQHVRDLRGVIARENAEIGVLISMQEPTRPMRAEAAAAGFYRSGTEGVGTWGTHPKLQLLTIDDLLNDKSIDMPPASGTLTFPRAPVAPRYESTPALFGLD